MFKCDRNGLLVFTRFPQPGQTKTRLIPALGADGAADLQRQMTVHLLKKLMMFWPQRFSGEASTPEQTRSQTRLQIHFSGGTVEQMQTWLESSVTSSVTSRSCSVAQLEPPPIPPLIAQCEGDLGMRLRFALQQGFENEFERIVVMGSDCPAVSEPLVTQAVNLLAHYDVVLGPALDGGYYLMGLRKMALSRFGTLFENIPWSTDNVLSLTLKAAASAGLSVDLLQPLSDIDRPEDLPMWYALQKNSMCCKITSGWLD